MQVLSSADGARLIIDLGPLIAGLARGDSVAINGACLTVCQEPSTPSARASFDVVAETLAKTTLASLKPGDRVNLERALKLSDALDGHLVQGHIDGTGRVSSIDRAGQWKIVFHGPPDLTAQMARKGSVTIDGVSLTLAEIGPGKGTFSIALIPTTLDGTTLGKMKVGAKVNIETDVIGKYVFTYLENLASRGPDGAGLTLDKLRQAGFM